MFKNSVFRVSVDTKKWLKAAGVRAVKTMAQTAIATIGVGATMGTINWIAVGSASLVAGIISIFTSVSGLPEVKSDEVQ